MEGFEPGTECVITWVNSEAIRAGFSIGADVTSGTHTQHGKHGLAQEVLGDVPPADSLGWVYPVKWMRRADEDPDESIMDEMESIMDLVREI